MDPVIRFSGGRNALGCKCTGSHHCYGSDESLFACKENPPDRQTRSDGKTSHHEAGGKSGAAGDCLANECELLCGPQLSICALYDEVKGNASERRAWRSSGYRGSSIIESSPQAAYLV